MHIWKLGTAVEEKLEGGHPAVEKMAALAVIGNPFAGRLAEPDGLHHWITRAARTSSGCWIVNHRPTSAAAGRQ